MSLFQKKNVSPAPINNNVAFAAGYKLGGGGEGSPRHTMPDQQAINKSILALKKAYTACDEAFTECFENHHLSLAAFNYQNRERCSKAISALKMAPALEVVASSNEAIKGFSICGLKAANETLDSLQEAVDACLSSEGGGWGDTVDSSLMAKMTAAYNAKQEDKAEAYLKKQQQ